MWRGCDRYLNCPSIWLYLMHCILYTIFFYRFSSFHYDIYKLLFNHMHFIVNINIFTFNDSYFITLSQYLYNWSSYKCRFLWIYGGDTTVLLLGYIPCSMNYPILCAIILLKGIQHEMPNIIHFSSVFPGAVIAAANLSVFLGKINFALF